MNKRTTLIVVLALIVGAGIVFRISEASELEYPFNKSNITAIKGIEIDYRVTDEIYENNINARLQMNFWINVSENVTDYSYCTPKGTYSHCNYKFFVFYTMDSNNLQNTNVTIRDAVKDFTLSEWNYSMNNNQMNIMEYTQGNNIK